MANEIRREYFDTEGNLKAVEYTDMTVAEIHAAALAAGGGQMGEEYMKKINELTQKIAKGKAQINVIMNSATNAQGQTLSNPDDPNLQSTIDQGQNDLAMQVAAFTGDQVAMNQLAGGGYGTGEQIVGADGGVGGGGAPPAGGGGAPPMNTTTNTGNNPIGFNLNAPSPFGVSNPNVYGQAYQQAVGQIPDYNIFQRFLATQPYAFDPYIQSAASQQYQPLQLAYSLQRGYGSDTQAVQNALAGQGAYSELDMAGRLAAIGQGGLGNDNFGNPFAQFLSGSPDMSVGNLQNLVGGAYTALNMNPDQLASSFINNPLEASRQAVLKQQLRTDPQMQARVVGLPIMQQIAPQARGAAENILSNIYNRYMAANPTGDFLNYAQGINLGGAFGA